MNLILWARQGRPDESALPAASAVVLWQAFLPDEAPASWHSVPQVVMDRRDDYLDLYRRGLHDLGVSTAPISRIGGLDYWWLTLPADYSLEPDSPASVIVRLLALRDIVASVGSSSVVVHGAHPGQRRMLETWAHDFGFTIAFVDDSADTAVGRARVYRRLPLLAGLRALVSMWPSPTRRGIQRELALLPPGGIVVVDYLAQLRGSHSGPAVFESGYWGPLVDVLRETGAPITWLHNSADFATRAVVARDEAVVSSLDRPGTSQRHLLIQSALTTGGMFDAVRTWFGIRAVYRGVRRQVSSSRAFGFDVWPVIEHAMRDSILGRSALINAVWITQFRRLATSLPPQAIALLLFECQPWEIALSHAWRGSGHGRIIGVCHAAVSPWNTRLLQDPRSASQSRSRGLDAVVVSSPRMRELFSQAGYTEDRLLDAEALRFMHLSDRQERSSRRIDDRVLVLGEYSESLDDELRCMVDSAIRSGDLPGPVYYRPHPTRRDAHVEPSLKRDESASIDAALSCSRAAICGPTTSTALEAAAMGVLTVIVPDPRALNASPADGLALVRYASSRSALAHELAVTDDVGQIPHDEVMWTDAGLPRWRALVASWLA